jgi:hypothetical protein
MLVSFLESDGGGAPQKAPRHPGIKAVGGRFNTG